MKNLLPYLGVLALGASIAIAINDKAAAQTPKGPALAQEVSSVQLIGPSSDGVSFEQNQGCSIELKDNEFIVNVKGISKRRIPMSAVAWYHLAGENPSR